MGEIPACLEYLDLAMDKILDEAWALIKEAVERGLLFFHCK